MNKAILAAEEPLPPLPDAIPVEEPTDPLALGAMGVADEPIAAAPGVAAPGAAPQPVPIRFRSLRHGCYLLRYTPNASAPFLHYDGTLRVERAWFNTTASGDLYTHKTFSWPPRPVIEPSPTRIPIFPRARYRYYMRVTQILEWFTLGNSFMLGYELFSLNQTTNSWSNQGSFTARMAWTTPPAGHPSGTDFLTGEVKNKFGAVVGRLTMAWVSPYLRRAVIEIDRVRESEFPEESGYEDNNGDDIDWRHVFKKVGWNITVVESDPNLAEPSGASWSNSELHDKMLRRRDSADLDSEWRYHLLCVRQLDATSRGIMYDAFGGDSNNIPREGAAISSHWVIPDTPQWGKVAGQRFGASGAPYFRTAVHEIGHAMGLYHNSADNGFMNTTGVIASRGTASDPFPDNVLWAFHPDDEKRLRHMPDPWVRPGMIPFGQSYSVAPISPDDMVAEVEDLQLNVTASLDAVPIGAPARVDIELVNKSSVRSVPVPKSLSLKAGSVHGKVTDPSGTVRTFWPLVRCIDEEEVEDLAPETSKTDSLTLVRGADGALFPLPGAYQVTVEVDWDIEGVPVQVSGNTTLMVTPAADEAHAKAALEVLSTPDVLLALVVGGDHLVDGVKAIQTAVKNPVLRPHFSVIEAKRLGKAGADLKTAARLIDEKTVVTAAELDSWSDIVKPSARKKDYKDLIEQTESVLKKRVSQLLAEKTAAGKAG